MKSGDIIEHIGHILIVNPELLNININILKKYGINFKECIVGDGINVLAQFDLEEKINTIVEMGEFDEISNNKALALELLLKKIRTINFKKINSNSLVKGNL